MPLPISSVRHSFQKMITCFPYIILQKWRSSEQLVQVIHKEEEIKDFMLLLHAERWGTREHILWIRKGSLHHLLYKEMLPLHIYRARNLFGAGDTVRKIHPTLHLFNPPCLWLDLARLSLSFLANKFSKRPMSLATMGNLEINCWGKDKINI